MPRKLLCMVVFMPVMLAGCGMMANKEMGLAIDVVACQAAIDLDKAKDGTMDSTEAVTVLTRNTEAFALFASAKTLNLFEFWFSADHGLLVNGEYAQRLDNTFILAAETLIRATGAAQPVEWLRKAVEMESKVLIDIKAAKDGKRSPAER